MFNGILSVTFTNSLGTKITISSESMGTLAAEFAAMLPSEKYARVDDDIGFHVGYVYSDGTCLGTFLFDYSQTQEEYLARKARLDEQYRTGVGF